MELNENSYISAPEFPTRRTSDSSQTPLRGHSITTWSKRGNWEVR